jgi:hypothetical protein
LFVISILDLKVAHIKGVQQSSFELSSTISEKYGSDDYIYFIKSNYSSKQARCNIVCPSCFIYKYYVEFILFKATIKSSNFLSSYSFNNLFVLYYKIL